MNVDFLLQVLTELTSSCCAVVEFTSFPVLCQMLSALLKGPAQVNPHVPAPVMAAKSEVKTSKM